MNWARTQYFPQNCMCSQLGSAIVSENFRCPPEDALDPWLPRVYLSILGTRMKSCSVRFNFNPQSANHNNCRLLCLLPVTLKAIAANSVDQDQTAPLGAVWSGSTLFAYIQNVSFKSLQEDAADGISR